jgi:hypothetical protein
MQVSKKKKYHHNFHMDVWKKKNNSFTKTI